MTEDDDLLDYRVVVAFNTPWHECELLHLAAGIAARKGAPLLALLVEDLNLLNLSELPFAKEVGRGSAAERKLESLRLQRTLKACGEKVQSALVELNQQFQIEMTFKAVRGHYLPAVFAETGQVDILFLSGKEEPVPSPRPLRRGAGKTPSIWVLYDGSREADRALRLGLELVHTNGHRFCVALAAATESERQALRQRVLNLCPGEEPWFEATEPGDAAGLLDIIRRSGCRMLVIKRQDGDTVKTLAEKARCPVVIA